MILKLKLQARYKYQLDKCQFNSKLFSLQTKKLEIKVKLYFGFFLMKNGTIRTIHPQAEISFLKLRLSEMKNLGAVDKVKWIGQPNSLNSTLILNPDPGVENLDISET